MQGFLISHGESWDELNDIWQYKVISLLIKIMLWSVKTGQTFCTIRFLNVHDNPLPSHTLKTNAIDLSLSRVNYRLLVTCQLARQRMRVNLPSGNVHAMRSFRISNSSISLDFLYPPSLKRSLSMLIDDAKLARLREWSR